MAAPSGGRTSDGTRGRRARRRVRRPALAGSLGRHRPRPVVPESRGPLHVALRGRPEAGVRARAAPRSARGVPVERLDRRMPRRRDRAGALTARSLGSPYTPRRSGRSHEDRPRPRSWSARTCCSAERSSNARTFSDCWMPSRSSNGPTSTSSSPVRRAGIHRRGPRRWRRPCRDWGGGAGVLGAVPPHDLDALARRHRSSSIRVSVRGSDSPFSTRWRKGLRS